MCSTSLRQEMIPGLQDLFLQIKCSFVMYLNFEKQVETFEREQYRRYTCLFGLNIHICLPNVERYYFVEIVYDCL